MVSFTVVSLFAVTLGGGAPVSIETIDYRGWKAYRLTNPFVELVVPIDIGPRIIHFSPRNRPNIFYVREGELGKSGEKGFVLRGGWRPWVAPEVFEITWFPDNFPCQFRRLGDGTLRVIGPKEPKSGLQKIVDVKLSLNDPAVRVTLRLRNVSQKPLIYAAWSLPVMRPGGKAIVPLDVGDLDAFADVRRIIFWSYGNPSDKRFRFLNRFLIIDHAKVPPRKGLIGRSRRYNDEGKIGTDSKQGWVAYYHPKEKTLFIKRFPVDPKGAYPDGGCTIEVYSCAEFIEVECLSPLVTIPPGKELVFPMEWWLFTDVPDLGHSEDALWGTLARYLDKTKDVTVKRWVP